ncbi:MAG: tryptophan halogenase family protein [Pseudomonadota bacterium]
MSRTLGHVVIVGGGSAGWLTAAVLAAAHGERAGGGLRVTLLESPDVPTIGVGEGTWPTMRDTLRRVGASETDFIRACDAVFKQGSKFVGWREGAVDERADHRADDQYYHPFVLPQKHFEADLASVWAGRDDRTPFAMLASFQPHLCEAGRAPKQFSTPEFAAVANYAYHLDAAKLGVFLREHCTQRLGVRHVSDHMIGIDAHENGDIAAVLARGHGAIAGDLFVDCTGLRALLLGGHYGVGTRSRRDVLFNDRALAVQVPYADPAAPIACQTVSTAQRNGWIWDIGLSARRGVGHVYSSAHTTDDEAETALRAYIERSGGPRADAVATPLRIAIQPGYRERFWHRNCVAVGLSSGFIEPLEASSLVLVELAATAIAETLPADREAMDIVAERFNALFAYRWERVIDFLKLHYALNRRTDSEYWRDHARAETIPDRLREQLVLWRHRAPSRYDLVHGEEIFPSASYQYVLYGMGFRPQASAPVRAEIRATAEEGFREAADLARRMRQALPAHRELIDHIRARGLPRI